MDLIRHLLFFWFCVLACTDTLAKPPVIAAAASLKFALPEIAEAFEQDTGRKVRLSFSSSGNLTRQIQQGAPFELFLSANTVYADQLQQQQQLPNKPVVYTLGRLVLITSRGSTLRLDEQFIGIRKAVQQGKLKHFAIANPGLAPYGTAARQVLQHQQQWTYLETLLIQGENVAQTTQFIASGAAQAGLVSYSMALAPPLKKKTRFILIPQSHHKPLSQTMLLLSNAGETAKMFYHYLRQNRAQQILNQYGYSKP